MKKYIFITLLFAISTLLLFKVNDVFAATCTQSGSTTYCTDTSTGRTTTYNQYGNNIYGSDGSSYSIYGDTTYGSGNVFNIGGNSGSSLPPLSTSGADMNSPEVKAAQARYDAACAPSTSSEAHFGGTQANDCSEAVTEWLRAVANSQKTNAATSATQPTNYNSGSSASKSESNAEFMERVLSSFGYGNTNSNSTQSKNLCVSGGILNSHPESDECICDNGYLPVNNKCVPLSVESCESVFLKGAIPIQGTNRCQCDRANGYTYDSVRNTCFPSPVTIDSNIVNPPSVQKIIPKAVSKPKQNITPDTKPLDKTTKGFTFQELQQLKSASSPAGQNSKVMTPDEAKASFSNETSTAKTSWFTKIWKFFWRY